MLGENNGKTVFFKLAPSLLSSLIGELFFFRQQAGAPFLIFMSLRIFVTLNRQVFV